MKKAIILGIIAVAVLIAILGIMQMRRPHTVSDFSFYPCKFAQSDEISIDTPMQHVRLKRDAGTWRMAEPYDEALDMVARSELERFLYSKMFIDEIRPLNDETRHDVQNSTPTHLVFKGGGEVLCAFELGQGIRPPAADAERRWVFPDGEDEARRTFVPLMDYGPLFEQPVSGWRHKKGFESPERVDSLDIWTEVESYSLDTSGTRTGDNPQGWTVKRALSDGASVDTSRFEIDERRVATVLELINPLYVDDWASPSPEERTKISFGGKLTFGIKGQTHTLEIGSEVDFSAHPEWMNFGEGTRYVRLDGGERLGVMSAQRVLGVFPSLNDMRSKRVWHLDSTRLAAIDIVQGELCARLTPQSSQHWQSAPCDGGTPTELSPHTLGVLTKTLVSLQAVRYATRAELPKATEMLVNPDAEIRMFETIERQHTLTLQLSAPLKSLFRYARVVDMKAPEKTSPIFVLTEGISAVLLKKGEMPTH